MFRRTDTTQTATENPSTSPRRPSRAGKALLTLALLGGAVGGGVTGSALTAQLLAPQSAQAAVVVAQPIAQTDQTTVASAVYKQVSPSVVEITTTSTSGRGTLRTTGIGSGFVIDGSGLILTNNHVVAGASGVQVQFSTGDTRTGTVVGSDSANDLAVVRVDSLPKGVSAVTLGDSSKVAVGETAVAIGSPFGLEQTVTEGIISAVNRDWSASGSTLSNLLQTDAPINPGNSGGPLLNANGEVIGITTSIESPVEGNVGIGFAVPINTAKQQLAQLEAGATLQQGYLGISFEQSAITSASATGVTVASVQTGSGAAAAGIQADDVITAVNGTPVATPDDLVAQMASKQPGDKVTLSVKRSGQTRQVTVTLQAQSTAS